MNYHIMWYEYHFIYCVSCYVIGNSRDGVENEKSENESSEMTWNCRFSHHSIKVHGLKQARRISPIQSG